MRVGNYRFGVVAASAPPNNARLKMLQRSELLAPQASKGRAIESPVSAWWRHGGRMLNKLFDAPRFSRGAGPRTAPRRAGSLRKNHFLPVRGRPRPGSTPFFSGLGISSQTQCRNDKTCKCLFSHHDAPALLKAPSRPKILAHVVGKLLLAKTQCRNNNTF